MLYEKPDFQGRTIALEEGGIELNNMWAENDADTDPQDGSPMLIGSMRLVVWVNKNPPLLLENGICRCTANRADGRKECRLLLCRGRTGGLQATPGNCCVSSAVSAGLQRPLHRSVYRARGPGQNHVLPRRHDRDGHVRHPAEHCLNPGVFWGVSMSVR